MKSISILLIMVMLFNCNTKPENSYAFAQKPNVELENSGKKLLETHCYICHSPTASHDNRIAPPMVAIKRHYKTDNTSKEDFVNSIQEWIKNPNEEDARMYGAVRRFGVMPKASYSDDVIKQIAEYLYDNDIEKPEWFDEHHKKNKKGYK